MGHSSKQASIVWFNKILAFSVGIATCPSHRLRRKYGESSIFIECLHRRRCEVCHTWQKDRAPRSFNKKARFRFISQSAGPSRIGANSPQSPLSWPGEPADRGGHGQPKRGSDCPRLPIHLP